MIGEVAVQKANEISPSLAEVAQYGTDVIVVWVFVVVLISIMVFVLGFIWWITRTSREDSNKRDEINREDANRRDELNRATNDKLATVMDKLCDSMDKNNLKNEEFYKTILGEIRSLPNQDYVNLVLKPILTYHESHSVKLDRVIENDQLLLERQKIISQETRDVGDKIKAIVAQCQISPKKKKGE